MGCEFQRSSAELSKGEGNGNTQAYRGRGTQIYYLNWFNSNKVLLLAVLTNIAEINYNNIFVVADVP